MTVEKFKLIQKKEVKFSLYWVTDGEGEDWFVISPDNGFHDYVYAEMFHDEYEGHEPYTEDNLVAPYSNADYICDVPFEILNRLTTGRDNEMTYIEQSQKNYLSDVETRKGLKKFFFESLYPDFTDQYKAMLKKELKKSHKNYEKIIDFIWDDFCCMDDYCIDIFGKENADINKKGLASCMLSEGRSISDFEGYGSFHAQIDILKEIEGMTIIDDGKTSHMRVVAFDGNIYSEGDMEAQIQEVWNIYKQNS